MKQQVRAKKTVPMKGSPRFTRALGTPVMVLLVLSVMGAAILIASYQPSHTPDTAAVDPQPRQSVAAAQERAKRAASSTVPAAAPVAATPRRPDVSAADVGAESTARTASTTAAAVTITGCLELDDETFRLKNTMGEDAPKARSWKSGFLKKSPTSIEVVDASHRLKLPAHVGQRVSVTGVLVGREMQVRSMQRVAASCNQKS
jgi:hypothetical protein